MAPRIFDQKDLGNLKRVLDSGQLCSLGGGTITQEFEEAFKRKINAKYAIAANSAMSGLHVAVAAAGVGPGDEVIVDPIVHFAGIAVMYNNGVPIFADVDKDTHNIDPDSIRERVTPYTKAIICTHLWGLPCEMDAIMEIADEHNLIVIEDCAHALLAQYKGRYTGTLGHIGVFSFQQSKHLATGDGGMIVANDDDLFESIRLAWQFGATCEKLAWNYRITEMASAVGLAQLDHAEDYVNQSRRSAEIIGSTIADCEWLKPQPVPKYSKHSHHFIVPAFYGDEYRIDYDRFKQICSEMGVGASFGYTMVPAYQYPLFAEPVAYGKGCPTHCPLYKGDLRYGKGSCPTAEELIPRMMLIYTTLLDEQSAQAIAGRLQQAIEKVQE